MAPTIPVIITKTAVSNGIPPITSDTLTAMGVVTDFGTMESAVIFLPPTISTKRYAEIMPNMEDSLLSLFSREKT